jgi:putative intracellular protease/amidase
MQKRGVEFDLVSTDYIIQDEITMRPNKIEQTVYEVEDLSKYDGIMVVSGNMEDTEAYWTDKKVLSLVRESNEAGKVIGAICCSVPTIREATNGKKVSFFPLLKSKDLLRRAGAILQSVAMTRDQNLVTAEHQMASQMWAEEYCNLLLGLPPEFTLLDSGFIPRGGERKPIPELERIKEARAKYQG